MEFRHRTLRSDAQRQRCRRGIIGQFDNGDDVIFAEREEKRMQLAAERLAGFGDGVFARLRMQDQRLGGGIFVGDLNHIERHDDSLRRGSARSAALSMIIAETTVTMIFREVML